MKKEKPYKRLPGRKNTFSGYNTLWLGSDHLLSINSSGYSEDYRRFYYEDIQCIITRKTPWGKFLNVMYGLFAFLFLVSALAVDGEASYFLWGMACFNLFVTLSNWLLGPTSQSHLKTTVQLERLPSLHRLKSSRKAIALIKTRIEKAQGVLEPDKIEENIEKTFEDIPWPKEPHPPIKSINHSQRNWYTFLFYLLIFAGLCYFASFFYNHLSVSLIQGGLIVGIILCIIVVFVKQHGNPIPKSLQLMTFAGLGYVAIEFIYTYILFVFTLVKDIDKAKAMQNEWEMLKIVSDLSPMDNAVFMSVTIILICIVLFIGISGLIIVKTAKVKDENYQAEEASSSNTTGHKKVNHGKSQPTTLL